MSSRKQDIPHQNQGGQEVASKQRCRSNIGDQFIACELAIQNACLNENTWWKAARLGIRRCIVGILMMKENKSSLDTGVFPSVLCQESAKIDQATMKVLIAPWMTRELSQG